MMEGPLAEYLDCRNADYRLHTTVEYSRNLPFRPAWAGFGIRRSLIGRFYLRPVRFSLGDRNRVRRHHPTSPQGVPPCPR